MGKRALLMKILLFGSKGQIGSYLQKYLINVGKVAALTRQDCDLVNSDQITKSISAHDPDIIINAAAYTNVDKAESQQELAKKINADAVKIMADSAEKAGALLVHYSTDYVFDGAKKKPYTEDDSANPISVYGVTKFQGEEHIRKSGCNHLILRTSWIYSSPGKNFVNSIVSLAKNRNALSVVQDQIGAPTSAEFVAQATVHCLGQGVNNDNMGTYHLTSGSYASWYELAKYILNYFEENSVDFALKSENITPISSSEYQSAAARPNNSALSTKRIRQMFDLEITSWEQQLEPVLQEIKQREVKYIS